MPGKFIRVKDKRTKHQYDVHEQRFDETIHERVARVEPAEKARPPKPHIDLAKPTAKSAATKSSATKTSANEADEGTSPTGTDE